MKLRMVVEVVVVVALAVVRVRVRMMKKGKIVAAGFVYSGLGTRIRGDSILTTVAYGISTMLEDIGRHCRRNKHAEGVAQGE